MPALNRQPANPESVFTYGAPQLKVGSGAAATRTTSPASSVAR
jgi:hypothetical protein